MAARLNKRNTELGPIAPMEKKCDVRCVVIRSHSTKMQRANSCGCLAIGNQNTPHPISTEANKMLFNSGITTILKTKSRSANLSILKSVNLINYMHAPPLRDAQISVTSTHTYIILCACNPHKFWDGPYGNCLTTATEFTKILLYSKL
jgi:hypothetical protein